MKNTAKISLAVAVAAVFVVRLIPHPERTAHGFGELFHTTSDPEAAQMRILPGSDEDHFSVVETQGKSCQPDDWENTCVPPYHYHTYQEETFDVKKGKIKVKLNGKELLLSEGEAPLTVPVGDHHTFVKSGGDDMEVVITLRPNPGNTGQRFFPNLFGTIRDKPSLPQIIYIFCMNGVRMADIPWPIHEFMCIATRVVAPILGYRHEYPQYEWKE